MKKIFKLHIDIEADITEQITPELIEEQIDDESPITITIPEEKLEKLQNVISYILKHPNYYRDILVGDLLEDQSNLGGYTELGKYFRPMVFEDIAHEIGNEMGPDYESFIIDMVNLRAAACAKRFYQETIKPNEQRKDKREFFRVMMRTFNEAQIPLNKEALDCKFADAITESEMISEVLMLALLDCLTTYKIGDASLELVKIVS
ncbi:MAG: hypothetical protein QG657_3313 [Acidobacteriota bacterium]|nr:hypothetical protein [Acidobacteriota bacterium]